MRPSDENQAGSHPKLHSHLRPNLMSSSRRSGHEDSILAKLERGPADGAGQSSGLRLAWYGGAVLLALGLTATLAWLAAGSGEQALETAQVDGKPAAVAAATVAPEPMPGRAPTPALVVDSPPEAAPPLRMLDPSPAPAAPAEVVSLEPPPASPAAVAPPVPAAVPEPAPESKPEPKPESKARLAVAAKPRPAARQSSRPPRTAAPARQKEQDDSDVALISAVIYHANGHAAGAADDEPASSCADDACRSRAPRQ